MASQSQNPDSPRTESNPSSACVGVDAKPTDDTLALVGFLRGREWLSADEIQIAVEKLGFERPSIQWVSARLRLMCFESAPRFERANPFGYYEYRLTSWAAQGLRNLWDGFVAHHRLPMPTVRPEGLRS
jgi:hypothetical protein